MAETTCPYCDYRGSIRSVEAHISGSSGGDHSGKVGQAHREDLREQVEADLNQSPDAGSALLVASVLFIVLALARTQLPNEEEDQDGA